ncbi:MAG: DUF1801 domain-containing protein [Chloroflexi bacterium]|nr:DUF1801 domain-containing protein [Chloroflexota bacterium]
MANKTRAKAAAPLKTAATSSVRSTASRKIDEQIASLGDWRGELLSEVRRLILQADPEAVEEWKWQNSAVWSHDGVIAAAKATRVKVRVTFAHGASLSDPGKLFNASLDADTMRTIDILEGDAIDGAALQALVREAVAYNSSQDGSAPVLLSGGNPQVPKGDGDAPVQAYIAAMPGWKSDVGRRLDALIACNVPDVRKAVRWNSPFYGVEGMGFFLNLHVFTRYVRVTLFRGVELEPLPPGSSKDPDSRHIDVHEGELDEEQVAAWVRQAAARPGWDLS